MKRDTPVSAIAETRPAKIAELEPGIFYVNIDQISDSDFAGALSRLEQAKGIVFDLRGYPRSLNASTFFSHLIEGPVTSAHWNIPIVTIPDQKDTQFRHSRWEDIQPQAPYLKARKAFITDGRAISYAESCMGIVEYYRFAEIVGGPTAGTNGNVNPFTLPGGYQVYWTGMKVIKHDGSQHHGIGIQPTIPVSRSRAGVAAGVDELLERAVQAVSKSALLMTVPAGGAGIATTAGSEGAMQIGYAAATGTSGSSIHGAAVISFRRNGVVVSEAAVPASPPTTSARVFIDYRSGVAALPGRTDAGSVDIHTGIALVNRGWTAADISYTLRDQAGAILATGHGSLAIGAHLAKFISQLQDVAPDFNLPDSFPTMTHFGCLDIIGSQPLSVSALRLKVNQRNEILLASAPVADLTGTLGNAPLYFPQFADGGGYTTTLFLLNTSKAVETGKIAFFGDEGTALPTNQVGGTRDSRFAYTIPPGGLFVFQTDGSPSAISGGSVQIIPDVNTSSPVGAGVIALWHGGARVTETGVPAATPTTRARIFIDQSGNHNTGLAIASPGNSTASVTLSAYQVDGRTSAGGSTGPLKLNGNGHSAKFVSQLISGLPPDFTGVLEIASPTPFAALSLRTLINSRGDFLMTTLPVADATRPAPSLLVFPQIADGEGYMTEFILLSTAGSASTRLSFYGPDGTPLAVAK